MVWRPEAISGDRDSSESALLHCLEHLHREEGYEPKLLVFLQATSPLTLAEDIDGAVATLLAREADSVVAVTPFHYFLWQEDETGGATGINHDKRVRLMREEREPQYRETGAVYVMRTRGFLQAKHRFFGKTAMHQMPAERCWEIDEPIDLHIADTLLRERDRQQRFAALPAKVSAVVLDFDGVMTDNHVIVFEDCAGGRALRSQRRLGHRGLRERGLPILVLSTEANRVVASRCKKLKLECRHGVTDKLAVMTEWLASHGAPVEETVYVGNDLNDLQCLRAVGCPIVVQDAYAEVKAAARIVLENNGGHGAVREVTELILKKLEETK